MVLEIKTKVDLQSDVTNAKHNIYGQDDIDNLQKFITDENKTGEQNDLYNATKNFLEEHLKDISYNSSEADFEKKIQRIFEISKVKGTGYEMPIDGNIHGIKTSSQELTGKFQKFKLDLATHLVTKKAFEEKKKKLEEKHEKENETLTEDEIEAKKEERKLAIQESKQELKKKFTISEIKNISTVDQSPTTSSSWFGDIANSLKEFGNDIKDFSKSLKDELPGIMDVFKDGRELIKGRFGGKDKSITQTAVSKVAEEVGTEVVKEIVTDVV